MGELNRVYNLYDRSGSILLITPCGTYAHDEYMRGYVGWRVTYELKTDEGEGSTTGVSAIPVSPGAPLGLPSVTAQEIARPLT